MTEHTPDIPLGSWLAALPDERLTQLLELRPDLAQPPPGSIAALAARAQARQSVKAATDELDFLRLAVFDALLVLQADTAPVPIVRLLAVIGDRAAQADVLGALADLKQRALAWGETAVRVATDAGTALPWHPGQVTLEGSSRSGDQLADLIAGLDPAQRDVLDKLLQGSPVGRTRDAAPGAPSDRPVPRLLAMGLLRRIDAETVILPRHVGQVLVKRTRSACTRRAGSCAITSGWPRTRSGRAAPGWWCCHVGPARRWSVRPQWPKPARRR